MVTVSGQPYDTSALADQYPQGGVERQVLSTMAKSDAKYGYDTVSQLQFELTLRAAIVGAARGQDRSGLSFATFHKSRCNAKYWDRTDSGGFRLKAGVAPSEAVADMFDNGDRYATECATAIVMIYYGALLSVYGTGRFNELFPSITLMNWASLGPLLRETGTPRKVDDILLGDRGYFDNPDVSPKTPELQGENVIVMPGNLYYGHGFGITTAERIIRGLNANRKRGATRSAYFMDKMGRPDFKKLAGLYREFPETEPSAWRVVPAI